MSKTKTYRIPAPVYAAIMRRRFVATDTGRAALVRELARLECERRGHKGKGACERCGMERE